MLRHSLDILDNPKLTDQETRPDQAFVLSQLGILHESSNREEARVYFEQSLHLYRAVDDDWAVANVLERLGYLVFFLGHRNHAKVYYEESLRLRQLQGDRVGIAASLRRARPSASAWPTCRSGARAPRKCRSAWQCPQMYGRPSSHTVPDPNASARSSGSWASAF